MTTQQLVEKLKKPDVLKIGQTPVVLVPLMLWKEFENRLEDLEMAQSPSFRKNIAKSRREKKLYSSQAVKKMLGFNRR